MMTRSLFHHVLTKNPTARKTEEVTMLLCLSCKHFYQLCPVPEKMEPTRRFASHASYRPEGCAQFKPVEFKKVRRV
jgi:hypothetical protein